MVLELSKRAADTQQGPCPTYDAIDLTKGGNIAQIEFKGQHYILRITKTGKLILTK